MVKWGLSTWSALVASVAQYLGAVVVFLDDPDKVVAVGPLATATATLVALIVSRTRQATALAEKGHNVI